jgi:hypothetical protein
MSFEFKGATSVSELACSEPQRLELWPEGGRERVRGVWRRLVPRIRVLGRPGRRFHETGQVNETGEAREGSEGGGFSGKRWRQQEGDGFLRFEARERSGSGGGGGGGGVRGGGGCRRPRVRCVLPPAQAPHFPGKPYTLHAHPAMIHPVQISSIHSWSHKSCNCNHYA